MDTQPPRVAHPVMYHQWNQITFLHWRYPPEVVESLLPARLTADTFDGTAWIGLTPFLMEGVRLPGLPYFWSGIRVAAAGNRIRYRCRRRRPATSARLDAEVELTAPLARTGRDELAEFLTARYRLFTVIAGRLAAGEADHPPWPLYQARVLGLDQDLLEAAGLPPPAGDPLAHASPGVHVRIGMWHPLTPADKRSG